MKFELDGMACDDRMELYFGVRYKHAGLERFGAVSRTVCTSATR